MASRPASNCGLTNSTQAATGAAFAALHAALSRRLQERLLTVVDATSVQAHARRQLTRRAAEAGILPGDRLIRWNGKEIGDVQGWMEMMGGHKPGDVVDVDVKRKGEEIRVRATLKSRDQAPK